MLKSKVIILNSYPKGFPALSNIREEIRNIYLSYDKTILLKVLYLSVDPYMRNRLNVDSAPYISKFEIDHPIASMAVAEVIGSTNEDFVVGDYVMGMLPWQEYVSCDKHAIIKIPYSDIPLSYYLGIMGMPGLTAHVGINLLAQPKQGDTILISSAAGAVGHIAVQLANQGCARVIASTGSDSKKKFLEKELDCETVINYKNYNSWSSYRKKIKKICPQGIDINVENVGGSHLEEMINLIKPNGKLIICGLIDQYNKENPRKGPVNFSVTQQKNIRVQDFIVNEYISELVNYQNMMYGLIKKKSIITRETIYKGIENAWQAFIDLFYGKNIGKMIVQFAPKLNE